MPRLTAANWNRFFNEQSFDQGHSGNLDRRRILLRLSVRVHGRRHSNGGVICGRPQFWLGQGGFECGNWSGKLDKPLQYTSHNVYYVKSDAMSDMFINHDSTSSVLVPGSEDPNFCVSIIQIAEFPPASDFYFPQRRHSDFFVSLSCLNSI